MTPDDSDAWARKLKIANELIRELVAALAAAKWSMAEYSNTENSWVMARDALAKAREQGYEP